MLDRESPRSSLDGLVVGLVAPGWPAEAFCNGIVTYTVHMRTALRQRGARVFVLAQHGPPASVPGTGGSGADENIVSLRCDRRGNLVGRAVEKVLRRFSPSRAFAWRMARPILREARRLHREAGLSILEMEEAFGFGALLARRGPAPVVLRLHGPWFLTGPAVGAREDEAFAARVRDEGDAIRAAHGILASSQAVLADVRSYYGLELAGARVIPYPMTPVSPDQRWRLDTCERDRILFVGRFDRVKGGDVMIDAFARLLGQGRRCRLTFVGPDQGIADGLGALRRLRSYVDDRLPGALADKRVEWLGFQPPTAVASLRPRAFVTIVPSRFETFGYTALEALALGCPLVASRAGGLAEIVRHERNGLLCRPGDAEDLAATIGRLLDDPALAARLGEQAAIDGRTRYHPDVVVDETAAFYREVAARRSGEGPRGTG